MIERVGARPERRERIDRILSFYSNGRRKDDGMHGLCDGVYVSELQYQYVGVGENFGVETDEIPR
jgi:hypothetical protein